MFGWLTRRSRRELSRELDATKAELAAVKAATADELITSTGRGSLPFTQTNDLQKANQQLAHYRSWVFTACRVIAQRIAAQPITLSRVARRKLVRSAKQATAQNLEPIEQHPLLDLLADPCPLGTRWTFMYATVVNILLTGCGFWWLTPGADPVHQPLELYWLPSSWIEGYEGESRYTGWRVRPPGSAQATVIPAEQMTYFHLPDPGNPFGAVSPLAACSAAVAADEEIQRSQIAAFKNGLFPRHAIVCGERVGPNGEKLGRPSLTGQQRNQLVGALRAAYAGTFKSGEPLILDSMIEQVIKLTNSPNEMDWLESGKACKARILQAFGVNEILAGQVEGANRASSTEAERHVINNAVNPLAVMMSEAMTEWLAGAYAQQGEKLILAITPAVPRDEELELRRWQLAVASGAVTYDELRAYLGLPPFPFGGDDNISPANTFNRMVRASMVDYGLPGWALERSINGKSRDDYLVASQQ